MPTSVRGSIKVWFWVNIDGDVELLEEEYVDVHAVAGLLKLFFRELSDPLLPHDIRAEFFSAAGI